MEQIAEFLIKVKIYLQLHGTETVGVIALIVALLIGTAILHHQSKDINSYSENLRKNRHG